MIGCQSLPPLMVQSSPLLFMGWASTPAPLVAPAGPCRLQHYLIFGGPQLLPPLMFQSSPLLFRGGASTPAPIVAVLGRIDECTTAVVSRLDEPRLPIIFSRGSEGRVSLH